MPRKKTVKKIEKDPILDDGVEEEAKPVAQKEEPVVAPKTVADGTTIIEVKPRGGKSAIMRAKLAAQPKVPIFIPLARGESLGATHPLILNGYRLNIKKGVYVHVPKQVADVVMRSMQQTSEAINNYFLMNEKGISQAMMDKEKNY